MEYISEQAFDATAAKLHAESDAAWQKKLDKFTMFIADKDGESGVFLTLREFLPYYMEGWRGTTETNLMAADAVKLGFAD